MTVADRAAEVLATMRRQYPVTRDHDVPALAAAGLFVTDDELELRTLRTLRTEAEQPDMQALADRTMRHVDAVNRIVEAAKRLVDANYYPPPTMNGAIVAELLAPVIAAVRALREDET